VLAVDMADTAAPCFGARCAPRPIGAVDILVNNTGGPSPGRAHESEVDAFEKAFRQHLLAFQTLVLAVVPGMKERGSGRIINIIRPV
jgi:3-oxoacyl-[acyl-carrier protein] reductase